MPDSLAENVARIRKARDFSQEHLAEAASVSVDTVAKIEQGKRPNTRPATLRRLAAALNISVHELLGYTSQQSVDQLSTAALRRAITGGDHIPGLTEFAEGIEVVSLAEMTSTTREAWKAYVDGRHEELLSTLPVLLVDGRRLVASTTDDDKATAQRLLSTAYRVATGTASRMYLHDLAWSSAERALAAAQDSDDPDLETAISMRYLVWTLVRQGRFEDAERVAIAAAERVQPSLLDKDPARAGVFGNLLFNATTAAVTIGAEQRAADLLDEAQAAAVRTRTDTATEAAIFGPRVAALQRIDFIARVTDPEKALRIANKIPPARGNVPPFWEAGHQLRLAAVSADLLRDGQALSHLESARTIAPHWSRHQPLGQTTMQQLIDRAPKRRGPNFAGLATYYGVSGILLPSDHRAQ